MAEQVQKLSDSKTIDDDKEPDHVEVDYAGKKALSKAEFKERLEEAVLLSRSIATAHEQCLANDTRGTVLNCGRLGCVCA